MAQIAASNAESILASLAEAIVEFDGLGRIRYTNPSFDAIFGYLPSELTGEPLTRVLPLLPETVPKTLAERASNIRLSGARSDNSLVPLELSVTRIHPETDSVQAMQTSFVGVVKNLTAQRDEHARLHALNQQLDHAARSCALDEMSTHIAHEMNQPLTAVVLYAQSCERLLRKGTLEVGMFSEVLQKLSDQALRAGQVNERVQRYVSRRQSPAEQHDINRLLRSIRPLAMADAAAKNINLVYCLAPSLPRLTCRATNVHQVTLNLLRNAFDAMAEAPPGQSPGEGATARREVVLRSECVLEDNQPVIKVMIEDQGPGITPELETLLAQSAFSTRSEPTSEQPKLGLGLLICRSLLAEDGGTLDCVNRAPSGCTFWFTLPIATEAVCGVAQVQ